MSGAKKTERANAISVYVDGSYIDGQVGYGFVVVKNGEPIYKANGKVIESGMTASRQVGGELKATLEAIEWLKKNDVYEAAIYFDYMGIAEWATGRWKTKMPMTRDYAQTVRNSGVKIHWYKVDAHTGDKYNEMADKLAKEAICGAPGDSTQSPSRKICDEELQSTLENFTAFLNDSGYDAEVKGIYNSIDGQIAISRDKKKAGIFHVYKTVKGLSAKYHNVKEEFKSAVEELWNDFTNGGSPA